MEKEYLDPNDVTKMRRLGIDLTPRWERILSSISKETTFMPDKELLRKSEWWRTGKVGAVHCPGIIMEKKKEIPAVLKIQGTKPPTSEVDMINAFRNQNESKIIRPPNIYLHIPWRDSKQYEAIVFEKVSGNTVLPTRPAPQEDLDIFFELYEEYRKNCRNRPWVRKPATFSYRDRVSAWVDAVESHAKDDPLREDGDSALVEQAIDLVDENVRPADLEFLHGHLDHSDLVRVSDDEVVLFSSLFWGWKNPFYDAVFSYHWWMLGMEHVPRLTTEILEGERQKWLERIYQMSEVWGGSKKLVTLALLERAVPALTVDRYLNDQSKESARIITEGARSELKRLIEELQP